MVGLNLLVATLVSVVGQPPSFDLGNRVPAEATTCFEIVDPESFFELASQSDWAEIWHDENMAEFTAEFEQQFPALGTLDEIRDEVPFDHVWGYAIPSDHQGRADDGELDSRDSSRDAVKEIERVVGTLIVQTSRPEERRVLREQLLFAAGGTRLGVDRAESSKPLSKR